MAVIHLQLKQHQLKTIIRFVEGKKEQPPGPHFYANKEIGCVLFICSADHIIMNLGHWKSSYLDGYSLGYSPCVFFAPPTLGLCSSSLARIKSRSSINDNSIS